MPPCNTARLTEQWGEGWRNGGHLQCGQFGDEGAALEGDAVELQGAQPRQLSQLHCIRLPHPKIMQVQLRHLLACIPRTQTQGVYIR